MSWWVQPSPVFMWNTGRRIKAVSSLTRLVFATLIITFYVAVIFTVLKFPQLRHCLNVRCTLIDNESWLTDSTVALLYVATPALTQSFLTACKSVLEFALAASGLWLPWFKKFKSRVIFNSAANGLSLILLEQWWLLVGGGDLASKWNVFNIYKCNVRMLN